MVQFEEPALWVSSHRSITELMSQDVVGAPLSEQGQLPSTGQSVHKVVLFADDDPTTRALVRVALEQDGWVVEDAEDGLQACEVFVRCRPDIVLLDVLMPVLDGFGACVKLRSLPGGEHVPVLMVTGGDDFESVRQAYDIGATDFLTKPVNLTILRNRLQYMLRAKRDLDARLESEAKSQAVLAKSRFLAAMSHELRAPLNSVIGFTNALRKNKHGHLSDKEMEYLQRIQSIGTDLVALIDDSLDLARVEAGEVDVVVEPVSVERLVADVLAKIEGTDHVQKLTLRTVIPSNTAPVMADSHRLQQVLLNLVANAVKFTEQGDVTVRVATDGLTPTRIEVEDQGIGIPKDQLESIFEPFQQADDTMWRRFGGSGLGLTICRSLCCAMGFALTVTSVQGRGSTFTIDLMGDGTNRLLSEPRGVPAEHPRQEARWMEDSVVRNPEVSNPGRATKPVRRR